MTFELGCQEQIFGDSDGGLDKVVALKMVRSGQIIYILEIKELPMDCIWSVMERFKDDSWQFGWKAVGALR